MVSNEATHANSFDKHPGNTCTSRLCLALYGHRVQKYLLYEQIPFDSSVFRSRHCAMLTTVLQIFGHTAPHPAHLITTVKSGTVHAGTDGVVNAGDTVLYSFTVTNTGQTCLAVLSVLDDNAGDVNCAFVVNMAGEDMLLKHTREPFL